MLGARREQAAVRAEKSVITAGVLLDNTLPTACKRPAASSPPNRAHLSSRQPTPRAQLGRDLLFQSRSVLRGIRVASKDELCDRIQRYIETCNECPLVPKWSYE
jgi:hypothetical protein